MIRLLIVLIFVSLVLLGVVRLVLGVAEGLQGQPAPKPPNAVPLVRDPVCGTCVVPSTALSSGAGSQTKFFCSENCRRTCGMKIAQ